MTDVYPVVRHYIGRTIVWCHENVFQTEMVNNLTISHSSVLYTFCALGFYKTTTTTKKCNNNNNSRGKDKTILNKIRKRCMFRLDIVWNCYLLNCGSKISEIASYFSLFFFCSSTLFSLIGCWGVNGKYLNK